MKSEIENIKKLIEEGNLLSAFHSCYELVNNNPENPNPELIEILEELNLALQNNKNPIEPQTAKEYLVYGTGLLRVGKFDEAINHYNIAIRIDPNDDYAYKCRHYAHATKGNIRESLNDIQKAIELNPDCALYYYDIANLISLLPDLKEKALFYYEKAIELEPKNVDFLYNYGIELENQNQIDKAIFIYRKLLAIKPNDTDTMARIEYLSKNKFN